ncbi:MAG TPA: hypothetical protein VKG91_08045 [Roseiarcus sp.]|nr:hypothetical protein [Roseiarcus sp.]
MAFSGILREDIGILSLLDGGDRIKMLSSRREIVVGCRVERCGSEPFRLLRSSGGSKEGGYEDNQVKNIDPITIRSHRIFLFGAFLGVAGILIAFFGFDREMRECIGRVRRDTNGYWVCDRCQFHCDRPLPNIP